MIGVDSALHLPGILKVSFVTTLSICAFCDVKTRRIPNTITISAFMLSLLLSGLLKGCLGLSTSFAGGAIAILAGFALVLVGLGGGGDMKLLAVCGSFLGISQIGTFLLLSSLALGPISALYLLRHRLLTKTVINTGSMILTNSVPSVLSKPQVGMPMAVPILIGGLVTICLR